MARLPAVDPGPRRAIRPASQPRAAPAAGRRAGEPDRLVKTHCCFCGQQCGIQLKVQDEQGRRLRALGGVPVQPREALPQGREALPAGRAPGPAARRRSCATRRAASSRSTGTRRSTARRARSSASRRRYGNDAFAVLRGASLTNEKAYLIGKFARVARAARANIDYNGRLCMVSAGAAYKKAFGIDRAPTRGATSRRRRSILVAGANIAECAPITTDYLWRARDNGAQADRARSADDADRPHRRPLPAGAPGQRHRRCSTACCTS